MGFNTVVLILNDHFISLRESPQTLTWALTHPPQSVEESAQWWRTLNHVADGYKERRISQSALKILPTFHMDYKQVLIVGGNRIEQVASAPTGSGYQHIITPPDWWTGKTQ